ncbi:hypothetical protein VTI74DRAFT_8113 [Chaetomium olivicolor]
MEQLGLPIEEDALAMADALAFMHWEAKIDANDVEFVLARPRDPSATPNTQPGIGSHVPRMKGFGKYSAAGS